MTQSCSTSPRASWRRGVALRATALVPSHLVPTHLVPGPVVHGLVVPGLLALGALASPASAAAPPQGEAITTQLRGSYIHAIESNGATVPHTDLRPGVSTAPIVDHPWGGTPRNADGRNLESYFIRNQSGGAWEIDLGADWTPGPGPAADFFVYEVGGNDAIQVRARLSSGGLGAPVAISGWSPTGVVVDGGPNAGQEARGVGFRFEDLRRPSGAPLQPSDRVTGLRIVSGGVDGAAFLVRDPGVFAGQDGDGTARILPAAPRALSPVTIYFEGPYMSETDDGPNPFLDRRLTVTFAGPGGRTFRVPGFFEAGGGRTDTGNLWAARFLPPVAGDWTATASMRRGGGVAISLDPNAGSPVAPLDGRTVTFRGSPPEVTAPGFFATGTLLDSGKHHRKFEFGPYYLKAGTNSPENFLALRATDDITKSGGEGNLHSFQPHVGDWNPGDPLLDPANGYDDGKGAIGALNYLHEQGVNSLFVMVMNLGGDGNDVYPFLGPRNRAFEKRHYDTSRLRQWNVVFEHAQRLGISLSLVMNETEIDNELWLDNGTLGVERKLFYREMIARFGHLPALRWNICEENDYSLALLDQFAGYVKALDADQHAVAIHNNPNDLGLFQSLVTNPNFDAASLQFDPDNANEHVELVRQWTQNAGRPWLVDADEMGPWQIGLTDTNAADVRKRILYDALFSGGGVEFYFGWHSLPLGGDLSLEDFRTREEMWGYLSHAKRFMTENLPFWDMEPHDELIQYEPNAFGGAEVFAIPGEVYAIYYPNASLQGLLDLQGFTQRFEMQYYDPRTGEFAGPVHDLGTGGGPTSLPDPPYMPAQDWVMLVRERAQLEASAPSLSISASESVTLSIDGGAPLAGRDYVLLASSSGPGGSFQLGPLQVPLIFDRLTRFGVIDTTGAVFTNQFGVLGATGRGQTQFRLTPVTGTSFVGTTIRFCAVTLGPYDWMTNVAEVQVVP